MLSRDNRKSNSNVFAPLRIIIRKNFSNLEFVESKSKFEGIRSISKKKNNPSLLVSFLSSQKFFQTDTRETKIPLPSFQKASSSSFSSIRTNPLATEYNLVTGKREEASQMPFDVVHVTTTLQIYSNKFLLLLFK